MKRLFTLLIVCLVCFGFMRAYACEKFGESVSVSFTNRRSTIDFDRLKLFFYLKQNSQNELRYKSIADENLVVIISRSRFENAKKQKTWGYKLDIRPRTYEDRSMHDFRKALGVELERLMKNGLLVNFTDHDKNDILSLRSFGDIITYRGEAGVGWESDIYKGGCGGPVELEGDIAALTLPL